jgi:hypothetical protein
VDAVREMRFLRPPRAVERPETDTPALRVFLRGGEVVRGTLVSGDSEALAVATSDFGEARIPFDSVLRIQTDSGTADASGCEDPVLPARPGTDVAHARSGDAFPGTLVSVGTSGVVLETGRDRRHTVAWADLVVLHLDEQPLPPAEGLVAEVDTVGGSRIVATAVVGDAESIRASSRSGLEVRVPLSAVDVVRWSGGTFVYACDLPFESTWTPYYDDQSDPLLTAYQARWYGTRVDVRPLDPPPRDCPIRLGGTAYRHGFAVHSKSVVTIPLRKSFETFEATFGIDDGVAGDRKGGDVTARVLADGKEIWSSKGSVRGGDPPRAVGPLPVEGVETLSLEVGYGEEQNELDRADWADPILVRSGR